MGGFCYFPAGPIPCYGLGGYYYPGAGAGGYTPPVFNSSWGIDEASGSGTTVVVPITPVGGAGHILIASVKTSSAVSITVTDTSGSNTWTQISTIHTGGGIFWVSNPAGGSYTVTATFAAATFRSMAILEYSGLDTANILDATATTYKNAGFGSGPCTSGAFNTSYSSDLVIYIGSHSAGFSTIIGGLIGANTATVRTTNSNVHAVEDTFFSAAQTGITATTSPFGGASGTWDMYVVAFHMPCPSGIVAPFGGIWSQYPGNLALPGFTGSDATLTPQAYAALDCTTNAATLKEAATGGVEHYAIVGPVARTFSGGWVYQYTVYARRTVGTRDMQMQASGAGFVNTASVSVSLTDGSVLLGPNHSGTWGSSVAVTNMGGGWFKVALTITMSGPDTAFYLDFNTVQGANKIYTGDGVSTNAYWGIDFRDTGGVVNFDFTTGVLPGAITFTRASIGTYFNNTGVLATAVSNTPRFNYIAGVPYLLIEPTATNLLLQSNNFTTSWFLVSGGVVTAAQFVSPDGTNNGWSLTSGTGFGGVADPTTFSAIPYTMSCWTKTIAGAAPTKFQLNAALSGGLPTTATLTRFSATLTPAAGAASAYILVSAASGSTNGIFGAQLETGPVATSYIPTTTVAVTRAPDTATFTIPAGVSNLLYTFDDNSTQSAAVSPGSYTIPTNLNRPNIKTIVSF